MKVLIVCDAFPPGFGPRMGYLCKYLSLNGVEVDVVCESSSDKRYEVLCGYARHVETVSFYKYTSGLKHNIEWGLTMLLNVLSGYKDRRLVRAVKRSTVMGGYDVVLCSTYKTFPLRAGYCLARWFKVPFVADLRDLVEQYPDKSYLNRRLGCGFMGRWIEDIITHQSIRQRNRVLERADILTTVSPWHVDFLKRLNPCIELIYNGYDPEMFYPDHEVCLGEGGDRDRVFRITFTGRIISLENRHPGLLFEALVRLRERGLIDSQSVQVEWFTDEYSRELVKELASKYGVEDFMTYKGFVPAEEVNKVLNRSSLLLQLANKAGSGEGSGNEGNNGSGHSRGPRGVMTTKVFEALAVGKPMLLVRSDESYLADLLTRYACGLAAVDAKQVEDFLLGQIDRWRKQGFTSLPVHPEIETLYSRKAQAARFQSLLYGTRAFSPRVENAGEDARTPYSSAECALPLFLTPWWNEAVNPAKNELNVPYEARAFSPRVENAGEDARMPYLWPLVRLRRLKFIPVWANPPLTQHSGPYLEDRNDFKNLLLQIPRRANLCINLGFELNEEEKALCRNLGISCQNRITHRLVETADIEQVFKNISPGQQRQIKKGLKYLHRVENPCVDDLIRLLRETFRRQGLRMPYPENTVRRLYNAVVQHNSGELVALADAEDRILAAGLFVYDDRFVYSLCHGYEKTDKNVGAGSLLQWEGMRIASEKQLVFDFEGSNIESIAKFNLSFGARPFTYTRLERYTGPVRILKKLKLIR